MSNMTLGFILVFIFVGFPLALGLLNGIFGSKKNFQVDADLYEYRDEDYPQIM